MGKFIQQFPHFYSVAAVLSLLHLRSKGFRIYVKVNARETRGGMQAASGSAEQEIQDEEVGH